MSLIECYECKNSLSTKAKFCPQCGLSIDLEIDYYKKNQIANMAFYHKGKPDGPYIGNYENGQKRFAVIFDEGKLDGLLSVWHENGIKGVECNFVQGKELGPFNIWNSEGRKTLEGEFYDKKVSFEEWTYDGRKKITEGCVSLSPTRWVGSFNIWNSEGRKIYEGDFPYEKKKFGFLINHMSDGEKQRKVMYRYEKNLGLWEYFYENGKRKAEVYYCSRGERVFSVAMWDRDGKRCPFTSVEDGNGSSFLYNDDGSVTRQIYTNGYIKSVSYGAFKESLWIEDSFINRRENIESPVPVIPTFPRFLRGLRLSSRSLLEGLRAQHPDALTTRKRATKPKINASGKLCYRYHYLT